MKNEPIISKNEWQILKVIWKKKQASVKEVWQEAFPNSERAYTTVQTYMDRMVGKSVLVKEKLGLVNFYRPLITEKQALNQVTESLVFRAFNGSFGLMAEFLISSKHLTRADLERIKKMIAEKEETLK